MVPVINSRDPANFSILKSLGITKGRCLCSMLLMTTSPLARRTGSCSNCTLDDEEPSESHQYRLTAEEDIIYHIINEPVTVAEEVSRQRQAARQLLKLK